MTARLRHHSRRGRAARLARFNAHSSGARRVRDADFCTSRLAANKTSSPLRGKIEMGVNRACTIGLLPPS